MSAVLIAVMAAACSAFTGALGASWRGRALRERAARLAHEVRGPLSAAHLALHGAARRGEVPPVLLAALELELRRAALVLDDPCSGATSADVDLHALLHCQAQTWQEVAAAHGAHVVLIPGPGAAIVHADALRVAQATGNVVANAIEHGGGRIEISTRSIGNRVRVEVADGGPGLPASVAELARRPRAGRGRRGRGLAIAASVLTHCGGRVAVLPSAAGGRVAIELPAAGARP
jgi:signal transduction histidine kinase